MAMPAPALRGRKKAIEFSPLRSARCGRGRRRKAFGEEGGERRRDDPASLAAYRFYSTLRPLDRMNRI
jgi:hypothetical protein